MNLQDLLKDKPLPVLIRRHEWESEMFFMVEWLSAMDAHGRWVGWLDDIEDTIGLQVEGYEVSDGEV